MSSLCRGTKKDGQSCSKRAKENGYCTHHQHQAVDDDYEVTESTSDDEGDKCQGRYQSGPKKGEQCTNTAHQNGYCHKHQAQAASSSTSSSNLNNNRGNSAARHSGAAAAAAAESTSDDEGDRCQGRYQSGPKKGEQCTTTAQQNGYCHKHQAQAASSSTSSSNLNNNRGNSAARHSGAAAAAAESTSDDEGDRCQGRYQSGPKKGEQCTTTAQQNGYCHKHQAQAASSSTSSSNLNNNRGNSAARHSGAAAAAAESTSDDEGDRCQGRYQSGPKKGKQCTNTAQQNGYCQKHQAQAASSSTSSSNLNNNRGNSAARRSGAAAAAAATESTSDDEGDKCQGRYQSGPKKGEQCTTTAQQNGYCHKHQAQAASSSTSSSNLNNIRGSSAARHSGAAAAAAESTSDDEGDRCQGKYQSGPKKGEQCTNTAQQNGYCHKHQAQAASSSYSSTDGDRSRRASDSDTDSTDSNNSIEPNTRRAATGPSRDPVVVAAASFHELSARLRSTAADDLKQESYRPYHSVEVAGCNGSSDDRSRKGSWLRDYNSFLGFNDDGPQRCIELKCTDWATKGGHLWVRGKGDVYHCYIGPVCGKHNLVCFNYPTHFTTKSDVTLMKMKSHECIVQWENGRFVKRVR